MARSSLKEKSRLHSHTIWYAGSCYNVYAQAVRKKGLQLGVYLHRQSIVDPIPVPSMPRPLFSKAHTVNIIGKSSPSPPTSPPHPHASILPIDNSSRVTRPSTPRSISHRSTTPVSSTHSTASFGPSSPTTPLGSPNSPSSSVLANIRT